MPTSETLTTLQELFEGVLGQVPPEFEGLLYLFFVMFLFFIVDMLFHLLMSLFKVR